MFADRNRTVGRWAVRVVLAAGACGSLVSAASASPIYVQCIGKSETVSLNLPDGEERDTRDFDATYRIDESRKSVDAWDEIEGVFAPGCDGPKCEKTFDSRQFATAEWDSGADGARYHRIFSLNRYSGELTISAKIELSGSTEEKPVRQTHETRAKCSPTGYPAKATRKF